VKTMKTDLLCQNQELLMVDNDNDDSLSEVRSIVRKFKGVKRLENVFARINNTSRMTHDSIRDQRDDYCILLRT
jgi:hypothetical protein